MTTVAIPPQHQQSIDKVVESVTNATKRLSQISTNTNSSKRKSQNHVGPWKLGRTLGRGSTGRVRLAKHNSTDKLAAVKIVSKSNFKKLDNDDDNNNDTTGLPYGIEREIIIMKLISHPNIMGLYDVWENKNELYLVLEYIEGGELFDYLIKKGKLSESEAVCYFKQIINGVDYCHQFNICHRDLKPENLLLDKYKNIKIADFGMAALEMNEKLLETSCGSPHYASPEIVAGKTYHGAPSDIWSCGIILFALLTGHLPFDDENIRKLLIKVQNGKFILPSFLSPQAKDLISKMLRVNPDDRLTVDAIRKHPLMTKYPEPIVKSSTSIIKPNFQLSPITSASKIDKEILKNLQILFHGADEASIVQKLLSNESNSEKIFYYLLMKYRNEHTPVSSASSTSNSPNSNNSIEISKKKKQMPRSISIVKTITTDANGNNIVTTTTQSIVTPKKTPRSRKNSERALSTLTNNNHNLNNKKSLASLVKSPSSKTTPNKKAVRTKDQQGNVVITASTSFKKPVSFQYAKKELSKSSVKIKLDPEDFYLRGNDFVSGFNFSSIVNEIFGPDDNKENSPVKTNQLKIENFRVIKAKQEEQRQSMILMEKQQEALRQLKEQEEYKKQSMLAQQDEEKRQSKILMEKQQEALMRLQEAEDQKKQDSENVQMKQEQAQKSSVNKYSNLSANGNTNLKTTRNFSTPAAVPSYYTSSLDPRTSMLNSKRIMSDNAAQVLHKFGVSVDSLKPPSSRQDSSSNASSNSSSSSQRNNNSSPSTWSKQNSRLSSFKSVKTTSSRNLSTFLEGGSTTVSIKDFNNISHREKLLYSTDNTSNKSKVNRVSSHASMRSRITIANDSTTEISEQPLVPYQPQSEKSMVWDATLDNETDTDKIGELTNNKETLPNPRFSRFSFNGLLNARFEEMNNLPEEEEEAQQQDGFTSSNDRNKSHRQELSDASWNGEFSLGDESITAHIAQAIIVSKPHSTLSRKNTDASVEIFADVTSNSVDHVQLLQQQASFSTPNQFDASSFSIKKLKRVSKIMSSDQQVSSNIRGSLYAGNQTYDINREYDNSAQVNTNTLMSPVKYAAYSEEDPSFDATHNISENSCYQDPDHSKDTILSHERTNLFDEDINIGTSSDEDRQTATSFDGPMASEILETSSFLSPTTADDGDRDEDTEGMSEVPIDHDEEKSKVRSSKQSMFGSVNGQADKAPQLETDLPSPQLHVANPNGQFANDKRGPLLIHSVIDEPQKSPEVDRKSSIFRAHKPVFTPASPTETVNRKSSILKRFSLIPHRTAPKPPSEPHAPKLQPKKEFSTDLNRIHMENQFPRFSMAETVETGFDIVGGSKKKGTSGAKQSWFSRMLNNFSSDKKKSAGDSQHLVETSITSLRLLSILQSALELKKVEGTISSFKVDRILGNIVGTIPSKFAHGKVFKFKLVIRDLISGSSVLIIKEKGTTKAFKNLVNVISYVVRSQESENVAAGPGKYSLEGYQN